MNSDFLLSQLRAASLAVIAYLAGRGIFTPADATLATALLTTLGPILAPFILSLYSNYGVKKVPQNSISVELPDKHDEPTGAMATVQTINGTMAGKVVGAILIGLMLSAMIAVDLAHAADLPMPAPAPAVRAAVLPAKDCTIDSCSGWYVGANIMGIGSNADILGSGLNGSVFAAGGMVGMNAGYQLWNGKFFAAAEVSADYDATGGIAAGGRPRFFFSELVKLGMGLQGLFNNAPSPSQGPVPINIPTTLQASLISPYMQVGAVQRPWGTGWASGAGASFAVGGGWNLDLSYLFVKYNNAQVNVIQTESSENLIKLSLNRMF